MKLGTVMVYADAPARRVRQQVSDAAVLVWIVVWIEFGRIVFHAVHRLGASGRELADAGNGLSGSLADAAAQTSRVPLVGSSLQNPLRNAGEAAARVAHAGVVEQSAVGRLALLLGLAVAVLPVLALGLVWLPRRLRWIRTATALSRATEVHDDDLLALRALTTQPVWQLQRIHPRVGAAYVSGDRTVIAALAQLERDAVGLDRPEQTA